MHRAEKASEDDIKPNHLSSLLEEYGELLSEKAKHYLNIDFALGKDETNDSDEIVEQQPKLTEIIKNRKSLLSRSYNFLFRLSLRDSYKQIKAQ